MGLADQTPRDDRTAPPGTGPAAPARAQGVNGDAKAEGANSSVLTPEAFAGRFEGAFRILWLIAVGIVQERGLADDVVQEAAIVALTKLDHFQADSNFTAWMGQTVRFVALNAARKRRGGEEQRGAADHDADTVAARATPEPVRLTGRGDLPDGQTAFDDRMTRALRSINEIARCCLLLRTLEGLDYPQISALLGIPEGTAMSHVHRTRMVLRAKLGGPEIAGSSDDDSGKGGPPR